MFPDPSAMSLVGWSHQFVDESLFDSPDDAGTHKLFETSMGQRSRAALRMGGMRRDETIDASWKHLAQLYDAFSNSASSIQSNGIKGCGSYPSPNMVSSAPSGSDHRVTAKNVVDEVLKDLNEVIELDDVLGPVSGTLPPVAHFMSHHQNADMDASVLAAATRRLSITAGTSSDNRAYMPIASQSSSSDRLLSANLFRPFSAQSSHSQSVSLIDAYHAQCVDRNMRSYGVTCAPPTKKQRLGSEDEQGSPASLATSPPKSACISDEGDESSDKRFRDYQNKQWDEAFEELLEFKRVRGNCQVPHGFKENPSLSRWVKRQRYQFKLLKEGKASTMTDERIERLEAVGFVWDSHNTTWERRIEELREYKKVHGHVSVPTSYKENMKLATWVKQQRRQYKLFCQGRPSNITLERIDQLQSMGFEWSIRIRQENSLPC